MKKLISGIFLCLFCLIFCRPSHAGPKWEISDDSWMKLSFLGQAHYAHLEDSKPENDFYLRRGRFILAGQITDGIKFFVETDNDKAGKHGVSASTDIQDAFMDVRIAGTSHWVKGGLILLPFSLETFSSAASLLGLDYNSEVIKLANTFVWRDYGVSIHGDFGKKLAYRAGFFDGYDAGGTMKANPDAGLRFTGHVAYSIFGEVETGWFYTQDKQGKGSYLTVGVGIDRQNEATALNTGAIIDAEAFVVDFQAGIRLDTTMFAEADLTLNGAFYDWDNAGFKGNTAFMETGVRVRKTMLTLKYSFQDPDGADSTGDTTAGLHYFFKGHNARAGVEYRFGDSEDMLLAGIQFLL